MSIPVMYISAKNKGKFTFLIKELLFVFQDSNRWFNTIMLGLP